MPKKRPAMSVQLAKAKTASDLGEIIADSWRGYGLEGDVVSSNDTAQLTVVTKPETLTEAFRYLWLKDKGKDGDSVIYRMGGMPYEILVTVDGEKHNIMIRKPINIAIKSLELVRKHLQGKHPQKSHAGGRGSGKLVPSGEVETGQHVPDYQPPDDMTPAKIDDKFKKHFDPKKGPNYAKLRE